MSSQPNEPTAEQRQAFLAAGNTEAQLAARIRDDIPLDLDFGAREQILLDSNGHGRARRDDPTAAWEPLTHVLDEPTDHDSDHDCL